MSVASHIQQLQQKHRSLEQQLADMSSRPSVPDNQIRAVKREKLRLKDEIARLQSDIH